MAEKNFSIILCQFDCLNRDGGYYVAACNQTVLGIQNRNRFNTNRYQFDQLQISGSTFNNPEGLRHQDSYHWVRQCITVALFICPSSLCLSITILLCTPPSRAKRCWAGCILFFSIFRFLPGYYMLNCLEVTMYTACTYKLKRKPLFDGLGLGVLNI